ncbi:SCO family protein [Novosphingobium sp. M1R2S20]|uniref:SCO family protein n=1 Tax=Novosphingobium rhizovicinum TaxID=3228928 RepID=A0ABV3RG46_9SPHN
MRFVLLLLGGMGLVTAPVAAQSPFDPFGMASVDERPGAQVPVDLTFTDSNGRRRTLAEIGRDRPIVLAPVLHNCPNLCGVTLAGLASAIAQQPLAAEKGFAVVAFGIDPAEGPADAAANLAALRQREGEDAIADAVALVGSAQSVRAVTNAIGFRYAWDERIGQYAHVAAVAVLTPDGRLSSWLYGLSPGPDDLTQAIAAASEGKTGSWSDRLLLMCYHYDPETGRYTASVQVLLKVAASLTVAMLALLVWQLRRRSP